MDESEDNMSAEDIQSVDSSMSLKLKPKKRSLVERELETNLTARVTSPVTAEGTSTSRYGRARRLKTGADLEAEKVMKPLRIDTSKCQPQAYKMHASNSPIRKESPKRSVSAARSIEDQIENIYNENMSLSRFGSEELDRAISPAKKFPKVYIRKDLTQKADTDTVALIKNIFSPVKKSNTHLNNILERSSEKYSLNGHGRPQNGFPDTSSVVKTLDFDGIKKKKDMKEKSIAKNELFELEAGCEYQVGDLAWARVGTYPFWPCIITREPFTDLFLKKKLFGRVEHDVIHVTFFGDNGRRGWIVDNLLRKYLGRAEFESARETFTPEAKKKDPRLYAAYFVSEKKLPLWNTSVDEAEAMLREPKRLRIDILHTLLEQARVTKITPKREKGGKIMRTDSDVSLSESLYDTLFSEDDGKADESFHSKKSRNKSLDVSEVVTACLDNMAAKSGIIKIQKQSHMDRWLQKAKSKTPEKAQPTFQIKSEKKKDRIKKKSKEIKKMRKNKSLNAEANLTSYQNEHDYSSVNYENHDINEGSNINTNFEENGYDNMTDNRGIGIISKVESVSSSMEDYNQDDIITTVVNDDIVINGTVNKNIDVIDENVIKIEDIQDISVINQNNNISSTENEQNKTKIESPLKKIKKANNAIQTRRSKRKRQSGEEDNSILEDKKPDKKMKQTLPNLDVTQTDISIIITNISDVENMNKDSFQECVLNNKILDLEEQKSEIMEREPVIHSEVGKVTKKSKETLQSELVQLNGQKAVVVIEPLKMSTLETVFVVKKSNKHDKVLQSKNKPEDKLKNNALDKIELENVAVNTESLVTQDLDNNTSKTTGSEPILDEAKNVTEYENDSVVLNKAMNSLIAVKKIKDKETVLSIDIFNVKPISEEKVDESEKMYVDDQNININQEGQKDCTNLVSKGARSNLRSSKESEGADPVKPKKSDSVNFPIDNENNDESNFLRDDPEFIKYLELRQDAVRDEQPELSQDEIVTYLYQTWFYEESNKSDRKKTYESNLVKGLKSKAAPLPKKIKKKSKAKKERKSEVVCKELVTKNVVIGDEMYIFDETLSQDYDEIGKDVGDEVGEDVGDKVNISPIDSSINEGQDKDLLNKDGGLNINGEIEATFSQDYDEIREAVDVEKKLVENQDDCLFNKEDSCSLTVKSETDCDNITCDYTFFYKDNSKSKKKKNILDVVTYTKANAEDIPVLDKYICKDADQIFEENNAKPDTVEQNSKTSLNNQEINELKEKKRKSPKLSLNRTKNASANIQVSDLKNDTTESPVNIFLDTPDRDKPLSENSKNDLDEPDCVVNTNLQNLIEPNITIHKIDGFIESKESTPERKLRDEFDPDTASIKSEDCGVSTTRRKIRSKEKQDVKKAMDDPEFIKYLEFRQDALIDEQPELSQDEIVTYLYQTWLYEESNKSDLKKTDDVEQSNLVKGLNQEIVPQPKKVKKKPKIEKERDLEVIPKECDELDVIPKEKSKRKTTQSKPCYNEDFSDLEEEDLETFNIFNPDEKPQNENGEQIDEVELYFEKLTKPKPNVFKGLVREKVCEICEQTGNLVKCKSCYGTFHVDCVKKEEQITEVSAPTRGRKKKKKTRGRKPKGYYESLMDSGSQSDERSQDANISEELDMSIEDETESHITIDAEIFEVQWELKMKEFTPENDEEDYESEQEVHWDAPPGQCEIVDLKRKEKPIDYSDFKCNNCQKYDTPVCFVCKSDKSPKALNEVRQKCQFAHCHRHYHLECLEYWPQTQFNSWEPSKANKKVIEYIEALSCPRHVCHTCVSDDPRGCKTRFCGDKLARCIKCPATYHSFTKCLPAGTQILTGSQIICPRHYEHRQGQVPRHVNTGWCFICALGGTLICCEYCPTSFHAECLNIKPPEGSYMCEDCETGRLPLYGEMVWVKLGHYRWWPGIILHPCEIPDNIMAVKHSPGEFVVRFFGQYDHYWVNRGRVFPFQEGDSGKISSQKSKIDAAFTTAMEHAQRACEILKNVEPNEEEEEDLASSLLPPHYVKLKSNKPAGALPARRDAAAHSLTQCDCDPAQPEPCGPYSHCLNRMLLTECGPLCRAGERCNNRAFERRLYPRLAPHRAAHRGWGLRTLDHIKQGQFVIEYVGELIDEEEFRRRMCRKHEIRDENFYFLTLDKERMIDAGPKGNLARFMNHCCEPNCETQKWTVLGDVRVGLFALRDIPANSEVTFNYNLECAGIEKKRCLCGARRCSGYIGAKPKQEEAQPKKIKVPAKRTYKKRKNVEDSPSTSKTKPPIKVKIIKPIKPRELSEIEKDLLIIKNATNGISSDSESSRLSSVDEKKDAKALKRKRVSFSTEEVLSNSSAKKLKLGDECKSAD